MADLENVESSVVEDQPSAGDNEAGPLGEALEHAAVGLSSLMNVVVGMKARLEDLARRKHRVKDTSVYGVMSVLSKARVAERHTVQFASLVASVDLLKRGSWAAVEAVPTSARMDSTLPAVEAVGEVLAVVVGVEEPPMVNHVHVKGPETDSVVDV